MPVTANNLRLLVNSRHPYVEHNLDSLVDIIRHSIQNTSAFEEIAQLLKTGHDVATIAQQLTRHPAQEHNRHPIRIGSQVMEGNFHKVLGSNIIHHWRRHGVVSHQLFDWQHVLVHFSTPVVQSCRYYWRSHDKPLELAEWLEEGLGSFHEVLGSHLIHQWWRYGVVNQ